MESVPAWLAAPMPERTRPGPRHYEERARPKHGVCGGRLLGAAPAQQLVAGPDAEDGADRPARRQDAGAVQRVPGNLRGGSQGFAGQLQGCCVGALPLAKRSNPSSAGTEAGQALLRIGVQALVWLRCCAVGACLAWAKLQRRRVRGLPQHTQGALSSLTPPGARALASPRWTQSQRHRTRACAQTQSRLQPHLPA